MESIADVFADAVPHFAPFVAYGAHQLYGKYEFEKEKSAAKSVLGPNGMPPLPARYGQTVTKPTYDLAEEDLQTYGAK